jgi:hypothetical protein
MVTLPRQRGVVAAKLANMKQGQRTDIEPSANLQNVSQASAAEMLNVSTSTAIRFSPGHRSRYEPIASTSFGYCWCIEPPHPPLSLGECRFRRCVIVRLLRRKLRTYRATKSPNEGARKGLVYSHFKFGYQCGTGSRM